MLDQTDSRVVREGVQVVFRPKEAAIGQRGGRFCIKACEMLPRGLRRVPYRCSMLLEMAFGERSCSAQPIKPLAPRSLSNRTSRSASVRVFESEGTRTG